MKHSKLFWVLVIVTAVYFIAREGAQLAAQAGLFKVETESAAASDEAKRSWPAWCTGL